LAVKKGYTNVFVYDEGFPAWKSKGYPIETLDIVPKIDIPIITATELKTLGESGEEMVIVDLRDSVDRGQGWIVGSYHLVLVDLMARANEIPPGKKVVVVDLAGKQTLIAGRYLVKRNYLDVIRLEGGMKTWVKAGYPIEK
jgi:rhodanese-related sulfurtransferase